MECSKWQLRVQGGALEAKASWVGGKGNTCIGNSGNFRKFQSFTSTVYVRDDVMGFECIRSSEKY